MSAELIATIDLGGRARLLSLRSPSVGVASVRLLLPARFEEAPDATWPVLYLLHGMWDDSSAWMRETDVEALTADLDLLVVMPDGGRFGFYTDWWNRGEGGEPMWETFHLDELRELLEDEFRAGERRAIAGLSMGGFGAMHYAARHPHLFRAAASFSGVVDLFGALPVPQPLDPQAFGDRVTQADRVREHDPLSLAQNLRGLPLYVSWGDGQPGPLDAPGAHHDELEEQIGAGNERFVARLGELGIPVTARGGSGTHVWPYWQRGLHEALPMLAEALGL